MLGVGACTQNTLAPGDATDGAESSGDQGGQDTLEPVLDALVSTQCGFIESCACQNTVAADNDCEATMASKWQTRIDAGATRGLTLDAACLDATLTRMQAQECRWPVSSLGHVCESFCAVYHGDLPLGAACSALDAQVSDCAPGLTCAAGTCAEPCNVLTGLALGQTCRSADFGQEFDDCGPGLACDWDSSRCIQSAGLGEPCNGEQCGAGLWCDWNADQCRAPATAGGSCEQGPCADGFYCDWNVYVCRETVPLGASCSQAQCDEGLICSQSSVCVDLPALGEACPQGVCTAGNLCGQDNTCIAPPSQGATCLFGECASALWCDFSDPDRPEGVCAALVPYGEACRGHRQCDSGYCPAGYCLDKPQLAEDCADTRVCDTALVCDGSACIETRTRGPAACVYEGW